MVLTLSASANIKYKYPNCNQDAIERSTYCIEHEAIINDI